MFDSGLGAAREALPAAGALTPAELIELMGELHRLEAMVVERKLAVIAEFTGHRMSGCADATEWVATGMEIAESEVGAALTVARHHAGKLMGLGVVLRDRLPRVRAAMARGQLDLYRVGLIESATRNVTPEHLGEVERHVLDQVLAPLDTPGGGLTGRRLSNTIGRIVGHLDPAGVRQRRRRAANERYVGISAVEDAMVGLFGKLPAEDGRKLDTRLRELANTVCRRDARTFDQRKADALGALVDGLSYLPCTCNQEHCPQQSPTADTEGAGRVARKPLVHVIMLDSTLHGDDEQPAYLDGYGLTDADTARDLAAHGDAVPVRVPDDLQHYRTHTTEDAPLPDSAFSYRPSAVLDTWIRILGGMCQWLHCDTPAWNTDLDHDTPFNHRNPSAGGKTTAAGMKPYCRTHHRITHSQAWSQRLNPDGSIDLISPTGHHYHSRRSGYLDLLGINPDHITDPDKPRRRRRTRAENQAARIRAERRHQQARINPKPARQTPTHTYRQEDHHRPSGDDEPCPF